MILIQLQQKIPFINIKFYGVLIDYRVYHRPQAWGEKTKPDANFTIVLGSRVAIVIPKYRSYKKSI